jgi:hypothetical protein
MPPHQRREGRFLVSLRETPQEFRIARLGRLPDGDETAEMADGRV